MQTEEDDELSNNKTATSEIVDGRVNWILLSHGNEETALFAMLGR
jgi:hypothetical protein